MLNSTLVDNFVEWAECNHLLLNVDKTREMVIDFRKKRMPSRPLHILGDEVKVVENYRSQGVNINNGLDWKSNIVGIYRDKQTTS